MTPDEIVACAQRLYQRAAFADNAIYHQNDQKAYQHARAAFHEAGRLLDFCDADTRALQALADELCEVTQALPDDVLAEDRSLADSVRLLTREARAPKTCGTCADWSDSNSGVDGNGDEWRFCVSDTSLCNDPDYGSRAWPADHGCPQWRAKEDR